MFDHQTAECTCSAPLWAVAFHRRRQQLDFQAGFGAEQQLGRSFLSASASSFRLDKLFGRLIAKVQGFSLAQGSVNPRRGFTTIKVLFYCSFALLEQLHQLFDCRRRAARGFRACRAVIRLTSFRPCHVHPGSSAQNWIERCASVAKPPECVGDYRRKFRRDSCPCSSDALAQTARPNAFAAASGRCLAGATNWIRASEPLPASRDCTATGLREMMRVAATSRRNFHQLVERQHPRFGWLRAKSVPRRSSVHAELSFATGGFRNSKIVLMRARNSLRSIASSCVSDCECSRMSIVSRLRIRCATGRASCRCTSASCNVSRQPNRSARRSRSVT